MKKDTWKRWAKDLEGISAKKKVGHFWKKGAREDNQKR